MHRPRICLVFGLRRFAETMKWHAPDLQPLPKCREASFVATSADVSGLSFEIMISNRFTKALLNRSGLSVRCVGLDGKPPLGEEVFEEIHNATFRAM